MRHLILVLLLAASAQVAAQQEFRRDTSRVWGGYGRVDSAVRVTTTTGAGETAYEWGLLSVLNNYAAAGENVAIYGQANSYGVGPIWGAVFEVADDAGRLGPQVGTEITMNMSGRDSGLRLGLDVVLGDGKLWRGRGPSAVVEGTIGVRVGAASTPATAKSWGVGFEASGFRLAGLHTVGAQPTQRRPEGWIAGGAYEALINSYGATYESLLRIPGASGAWRVSRAMPQIGCLRIEIDGSPYCLPVQSWPGGW